MSYTICSNVIFHHATPSPILSSRQSRVDFKSFDYFKHEKLNEPNRSLFEHALKFKGVLEKCSSFV